MHSRNVWDFDIKRLSYENIHLLVGLNHIGFPMTDQNLNSPRGRRMQTRNKNKITFKACYTRHAYFLFTLIPLFHEYPAQGPICNKNVTLAI